MTTRTTNSPEVSQALDKLASLLSVRDHSRLELQDKLKKTFGDAVVADAIAAAEAKRWLAPEEEIAARAVEVFQRKGKSRRYIEQQLARRGLPVPEMDAAAEKANALKLLEKKFGSVNALEFEERARATRYLANRGFDEQLIRMVLNAES